MRVDRVFKVLDWIFIAKAIGIILVVMGHFDPANSPAYWENIRQIIYTFHIPLFFVLSGYLFNLEEYAYPVLIKKKAKRLLYPFITLAFIFFVVKLIAQQLISLKYPVTITSLVRVFINPAGSYVPVIWFIQALFFIFLIYPLLYKVFKNNYLIILLMLVFNILGGYEIYILNKALFNLPFFVFGIILKENIDEETSARSTSIYMIMALILFMGATYLRQFLIDARYVDNALYIFTFLLGVLGALFIIQTSRLIDLLSRNIINKSLIIVGSYSMTIYLFHTMFESPVRILFSQLGIVSGVPFEVAAIIAVSAGVIFPLLAEKFVLRKITFTRKYILGLC